MALGLLGLALGIYLPFAIRAGWYYDDWAVFWSYRADGASFIQRFTACIHNPDGRKLECTFNVIEYQLFGSHRVAYALASIGLLLLMAGLMYAILRRCRLAWPWAAAAAALLIVFPGSDSSRLWPVASNGEFVVSLWLIGVLIALTALRRNTRWPQLTLHALAAVLSVIALLDYEIVLPLVALSGLIYCAAYRSRRALWRGAVDLGIAVAFVIYRLTVGGGGLGSGFVVHRTLGSYLRRAWTLVETAWSTWHQAFAPGVVGLVAVIVILVLATTAYSVRSADLRRRLLPWFTLLAGSVVVAAVSAVTFVTADDVYLLDLDGTFNRLNLPGSFAYACAFVALLGLVYELVRQLAPRRGVALLAVGILTAASAWHQLGISAEHKRAWEVSWSEQKTALAGYGVAVRGLPSDARLVGMGAPLYEDGFVPVFAANWDLWGAISYTTAVKPPAAMPLDPTLQCGAGGLVSDGALQMPYRVPGQPLYFIDARRRAAIAVHSQAGCKRVIARWGRPPFWGRTVTS